MSFPLEQKTIGGYTFGEIVSYNGEKLHPHLGTDYRASFVELKAPFDGKIINKLVGKEGGMTIWFEPTDSYIIEKYGKIIIRFLHLSKFIAGNGIISENRVMAITGDTGIGPAHLHLDISRNDIQLTNFNNFIDPEQFDWDKTIPMNNIISRLVSNQQKKINDLINGNSVIAFDVDKKYYYIIKNNKKQKVSFQGAMTDLFTSGASNKDLKTIEDN
jgi:hypothetical protein